MLECFQKSLDKFDSLGAATKTAEKHDGVLPAADVPIESPVSSDGLMALNQTHRQADMESGSLAMDTSTAPDPRVQADYNVACLRRRAWAKSKDSTWLESEEEGPQQNQRAGEEQTPSEETGQVPNNIASWLIKCRTPLGASLDDQTASPSKGVQKNGCSFEDDLSLGAEANHLQSSNNTSESCVSELLDLYEEDPEEILLNLGFGREEPDLASKVPSRFFNNSSIARGIDIKVYLGAQLQRMEVEHPNYALTSRFRQIEVLTTVANEFFQLYSQVSGQPVQRISSKDQGGGEGEENESCPPLKKTNSARNVAKLLKKTISKKNLLAASPESPETNNQQPQLNGHANPDHTHSNGHSNGHANGPEQNGSSTDPDHQADTINQKHMRRKDCFLATVTEESNGDGDDSPEQSSASPAANGEHEPESADSPSTNQRTEDRTQVGKEELEEKNRTSTPEKAHPSLALFKLAQKENTDSFEMEEINEDEGLPQRNSRATDLLRTVSQQSDSSGFAEEPSADSNIYLKVQESSDSCDSETTVTSLPSLDVATPVPMDQPAFEMPDTYEEEAGAAAAAAEAEGRSGSREDDHDGSLEQILQYSLHHLPKNIGTQQDEIREEELVESEHQNDSQPEPEQVIIPAAEQEPQPELEHTPNQTETAADAEPPTEGAGAEEQAQEEQGTLDDSGPLCFPPPPSSPVLCALYRAKQSQLSHGHDLTHIPGRGRGRRGIPLQRSSSLPSSLLSPTRVVSSVRIQFGRGQASCTQPRYSFKYTPEDKGEEEEEEEGEERSINCMSTLIINPASSSDSINKPPRLPPEGPVPPKPIPRYLLRSTCSLQSSSPPPEWSPGSLGHCWSTQSVPELFSNQQHPGQFQQNMSTKQNQQSWNSGQMMFRYPNPQTQYVNPSPSPSPNPSPSPYPFPLNPPQQYHSNLNPYTSAPNLLQHQYLPHHTSLNSLYQPPTSTIPQHDNPSSPGQHSKLHPRTPAMHQQGYNHLYGHQSPYNASPHGSQFASPYLGYNMYNMNPHLAYHNPVTQGPPFAPEHGLFHPGFATPPAGFYPGLASSLGSGHSLHPGLNPHAAPSPGASHGPSSTEMQLRRVLHDIKDTVQSLSQTQVGTPDVFSEPRGGLPSHKSLAEFQQKRQSLSLFRRQMMDLELSIIRQQAQVYKHLSPADRMEVEQLQSLRSAVREELQELEQQLEDRLMELTQSPPHGGLHRGGSVDSLSTASALRAMEPLSDLLREQLYLQSELSDDGHAPSSGPSSRSSSPVRGGSRQKGGVYRATININPVPPPRSITHTEEKEEEEELDEHEPDRGRGGGVPEEEGAAGGARVGNLQQLIKEIRESLAQEVRQEIYSELLAAVSPQPGSRQPL
ncbi:protein ITPRID2 isoform X2 [Gymnodraco acuticeps]|uniref:Protein ITPRID2 isoform X2 n=1 Tax=Gymnodraco acuticeps TaxID=8218 RepID=A0A6P8UD44_GYMAC|nr:protein ITPRID2 isoform X2 [Gymnodraco acuticeps]